MFFINNFEDSGCTNLIFSWDLIYTRDRVPEKVFHCSSILKENSPESHVGT